MVFNWSFSLVFLVVKYQLWSKITNHLFRFWIESDLKSTPAEKMERMIPFLPSAALTMPLIDVSKSHLDKSNKCNI